MTIERFWAPSVKEVSFDGAGWLVDPASSWFGGTSRNPEAKTSRTIDEEQALVLLGEPGIGKSSELRSDVLNGTQSGSTRVARFDMSEFPTLDRLEDLVFAGPEVTAWLASEDTLCLILDSLDEARAQHSAAHRLILSYVRRWPKERLVLRIACRTADWPPSLLDGLKSEFGEVGVYELLPLRRLDAEQLVSDDLRAATFLSAIESGRVVPLAARPLLLKLLWRQYEVDGTLPDQAVEIYERGLLALADESDQDRRDARNDHISAKRQLDIASWIAAASVFSGKNKYWLGGFADAPVDAALPDDLAVSQTSFGDVQNSEIAAALRTGLFAGNGSGQLGWAHETFLEFSSARWLVSLGLDQRRLRELLCFEDGRIYPQVRNTAVWAAALDGPAFGWLIETDPASFLGGIKLPSEDLRALVVSEVLRAVRSGRLARDFDFDYSTLKYPALKADLEAGLLLELDDVDHVIIDIARGTREASLVPALTRLALAQHRERYLRTAAIMAIYDLTKDQSEPVDDFLDLLRSDPSIDEELQAAALLVSWPKAISTNEVFDLLGPFGRKSNFGLKYLFLTQLAAGIGPEGVLSGLHWLIGQSDLGEDSRLEQFTRSLLDLAFDQLDDDLVLVAMAGVIQALLQSHVSWLGEQFERLTPSARLRLGFAVVAALAEEDTFYALYPTSGKPLFAPEDFPFLVGAYPNLATPLRQRVGEVISQVFRPDDPDHSEILLSLPLDHPVVQDVLGRWTGSVDLTSPEATAAREFRAQLSERMAKKDGDEDDHSGSWIEQRIEELVESASQGDSNAFWIAVRLITVRPGTDQYWDEHEPDLTKHARWGSLADKTKRQLVTAAALYIAAGDPDPERWLGTNTSYFPSLAGYRALVLLLHESPGALDEIEGEYWRRWAPTIVDWEALSDEHARNLKAEILRRAVVHARPDLETAVVVLIDAASASEKRSFLTFEIGELWSPTLELQLLDRVRAGLAHETESEVLDVFDAKAPASISSILIERLSNDNWRREGRIDAGARLIRKQAGATWNELTRLMDDEPDLLGEILLGLGYHAPVPDLDDSRVAVLFLWTLRWFPMSDDPAFDGAHMVGPREELTRWRDSLLNHLIKSGTRASVEAIREIARDRPDLEWLSVSLLQAEASLRRESWIPLTRIQLRDLIGQADARLVRSPQDLLNLVLWALARIQSRLQSDTPESHLLWDTHSRRPKSEDEISDYVRNALLQEVAGNGIVVNREVQVRRNRPSGVPERTDLRIDALRSESASGDATLTVIVESKGSWNAELVDALEGQLVDRYLRDHPGAGGVYLVFWFDGDYWSDQDPRRAPALSRTRELVEARLSAAHAALADSVRERVRLYILDASYHRPSANDANAF
ncbi:NACHT domain-containing protein [Agromyces cerinus]|uniref:NACHT domain-containing protein n=1 Tax=Agromyces cerinus subsp. cerinus TaxID=232089 RepID=A0A1N6F7Y1_9MICO|nr:ATP-binding protein [Agromyces cerinus]SIN91326.1 hypothetical protein SAMN05443544_1821 [Agromyces cerinus subsp. cerinus]